MSTVAPLETASSTWRVTVSSWRSETSEPISAPYARAVPSHMAFVRATKRSRKASAIDSWTYSRSMEMHSCPAEAKLPRTAPSTARARSASRSTSMAFLPPSSREQPTRRAAAAWATSRPVRVEPVNAT